MVVPFNLSVKFFLGGPNFSSGWCMVETRAQAMANERMDKLEEFVKSIHTELTDYLSR